MTRRSLLALLFIGILVASCAPSGPGQPTPDLNATIAANAQTMVAALFQTQTALAPAATNTALPTVTSLPTSTALALPQASPTVFVQQPVFIAATATPTGTYYTATPLASSLGVGCKNLRLINSYTDPDSPLNPGQTFTQYWQVENNGTCDWLYQFTIEYASGDKFGETTSVKLGNKYVPGKWTTFAVTMHAPNNSGTYKAAWRLTDGAGTSFGGVLTMTIKVGGPTKTPKPPTSTPDLAQTAAAAQKTADAAASAIAATQTAAAQKTASAAQLTADACALTQVAGGTCP